MYTLLLTASLGCVVGIALTHLYRRNIRHSKYDHRKALSISEDKSVTAAETGTGTASSKESDNDSSSGSAAGSHLSHDSESRYVRAAANDRMKLILCVRTDLGMGRGKIAAQCCHAAVGVYSELVNHYDDIIDQWENNGSAKICVRVDNEEQLLAIVEVADSMGIPTYTVHDAGHTQVAPNMLTVAAIGPASAQLIDQVTGNLKLLG
jgi:peptidyl-tRNA hydrolase